MNLTEKGTYFVFLLIFLFLLTSSLYVGAITGWRVMFFGAGAAACGVVFAGAGLFIMPGEDE